MTAAKRTDDSHGWWHRGPRWVLRRLGLGGLVVVAAGLAFADSAWPLHGGVSILLTGLETALLPAWLILLAALDRYERPKGRARVQRRQFIALRAINAVLLATCLGAKWVVLIEAGATDPAFVYPYRLYTLGAWVLVNVGLLGRDGPSRRLLLSLTEQPARVTAMSFGLTALLGTLLLSLPIAHRNPLAEISAVDSLFTAVSAVCVTGLTVDNVAATYSPFGQGVLFALFQAGGLGIMALSSAVAILAGRRLQARSSAMLAEMVDAESLASLRRTLRAIVLYTLGIELVGALLLWALFSQSPASVLGPDLAGAGGTLWAAVFHSVSAFCNAGFSVFATGTEPFAGSWPISLAFVVLIIIGGFGFPVLDELGRQLRARLRKERPNRLSLHCRVVLATTAILLGLGLITFLGLEWSGAMRGFDPSERLLTALFQSATMRTAGFQTLDFSAMGAATWMIVCLFMFIGAAPGSTGGGVKVTTLTVLFAAFRAELRGQQRPQLFDRAVPLTIVRRASGVFFLSVTFVAAAIFTLLLTEKLEPMKVTFEAFSAFATVGLSTGITPELSTAGRLVVTATMFVGRIGPLTLAIALAIRPTAARFRVPEERVVIG